MDYSGSKESENHLEDSSFDRTESELEELSSFLENKNTETDEHISKERCSEMMKEMSREGVCAATLELERRWPEKQVEQGKLNLPALVPYCETENE